VPPFVLTVLQFAFLALLYFFVFRAFRAIVLDLRGGVARTETRAAGATRPKPSRAKPPRSVVVLDEQGHRRETRPLDGTIQIGRAEACQVQVSDTYVSSFHARIFARDGGWFVEDLGSTNGTYVNQNRITEPAELRVGDRVRVGKTVLEVRR
jgi:pSer/pThr/pTyr-binding forkhead associated (FHA) protein